MQIWSFPEIVNFSKFQKLEFLWSHAIDGISDKNGENIPRMNNFDVFLLGASSNKSFFDWNCFPQNRFSSDKSCCTLSEFSKRIASIISWDFTKKVKIVTWMSSIPVFVLKQAQRYLIDPFPLSWNFHCLWALMWLCRIARVQGRFRSQPFSGNIAFPKIQ